jgi:hypothetical protein
MKKYLLGFAVLVMLAGCDDVNTPCMMYAETNDTIDDTDNDACGECNATDPDDNGTAYDWHTSIDYEFFWIGEDTGSDYRYESAWDIEWYGNFGGEDTPDDRDGYNPGGFVPDENPFYIALPYNDLELDGLAKSDRESVVPWATSEDDPSLSICKNRWVKIYANDTTVYAQWEDVGPSPIDDDEAYVFGGQSQPSDTLEAGIVISPAVRDYLNLETGDKVSWRFVDEDQVPQSGPWWDVVTTSESNK